MLQRPGLATRHAQVPAWTVAVAPLTLALILCSAACAGYQQTRAVQGATIVDLDGGQQHGSDTTSRKPLDGLPRPRQQAADRQTSPRYAIEQARRLGLGSRRAAGQLLLGRVTPEWAQATGKPQPPGTLLWPVAKGWYVRGYGSGEGGYHLAVDIMGERGSQVLASADGIVGYSGNQLRGYGRTVILIHPGGWITMYAHNDANHVVAGERVRRGQAIAALGNTGISRGPHVHYEFMHGGRNCDPASLFRPGVRHRWGGLSQVIHAHWAQSDDRPRSVKCQPRRRHPKSRYTPQARVAQAT